MKERAKELLNKILRDNNYSVTSTRQLVFELLRDHEPQSMHDLVVAADGRIDRTSIYRTIDLFERLGIAQRLHIGWKYKLELTDVFSHHHHHISCLSCGKIVAVKEDNEIEALINKLADNYDISADRHQLEIQGYCAKCRAIKH